ncbi:MAG: peptidylprolyl isomerase [Candidatus Woesebacteria bacterium]
MNQTAVIQTNKGAIEIELYPQDAPKTVENFTTLSKQGYYNNLTFHRVVPGFVIQGGDPNGNGTGGQSIYGAKFEDELNPETTSYKNGYKEGVVAMANSGPNTNGSQFFIMLEDNDLPPLYSIFGKVTKGIDVVKQIAVGDTMTAIDIT